MGRWDEHHRTTCEKRIVELHEHITELSNVLPRNKSIKLWMSANNPLCGCTFWSEKPEPVFYDDGWVIFTDGGKQVAGELRYSMPILFPKLALLSAGRKRVEIVDVSDRNGGRPAYVIREV